MQAADLSALLTGLRRKLAEMLLEEEGAAHVHPQHGTAMLFLLFSVKNAVRGMPGGGCCKRTRHLSLHLLGCLEQCPRSAIERDTRRNKLVSSAGRVQYRTAWC